MAPLHEQLKRQLNLDGWLLHADAHVRRGLFGASAVGEREDGVKRALLMELVRLAMCHAHTCFDIMLVIQATSGEFHY
jgi:hypothetical protein